MLLFFNPDAKFQQAQQEKMTVMGFLAVLPYEDDYVKA